MKRWGACFLVGLALLAVTPFTVPARAQQPVPGDGSYSPFIVGDGVLRLLYPTGWAPDGQALDANTLVFFSDEALLGRPADTAYAPGEASLALTLIPTADLERFGLPQNSVLQALLGIVGGLRASATDESGASRLSWTLPQFNPATGDRPEMAQASLSLPGEFERDLYLWPVSADLWALLAASTAPGERATLANSAEVMLQSVQLDGTVEALLAGFAELGGAS